MRALGNERERVRQLTGDTLHAPRGAPRAQGLPAVVPANPFLADAGAPPALSFQGALAAEMPCGGDAERASACTCASASLPRPPLPRARAQSTTCRSRTLRLSREGSARQVRERCCGTEPPGAALLSAQHRNARRRRPTAHKPCACAPAVPHAATSSSAVAFPSPPLIPQVVAQPAPPPSRAAPGSGGIFSVSRYQPYFDVDTRDVFARIRLACVPIGAGFSRAVAGKPDLCVSQPRTPCSRPNAHGASAGRLACVRGGGSRPRERELGPASRAAAPVTLRCATPSGRRYGPFWICATLVFVSAATGNASAYLSYRSAGGQTAMWNYDVGKARRAEACRLRCRHHRSAPAQRRCSADIPAPVCCTRCPCLPRCFFRTCSSCRSRCASPLSGPRCCKRAEAAMKRRDWPNHFVRCAFMFGFVLATVGARGLSPSARSAGVVAVKVLALRRGPHRPRRALRLLLVHLHSNLGTIHAAVSVVDY